MRKENILKNKSFAFALRIIDLYKWLQTTQKEYILSKQVLRSGTSIGAMIRESENAASRKDFLNKLNVALKEADETCYWLELLSQSKYLEQNLFDSLIKDCNDLVSMLIASVKTLKESTV
jgi:four helix bundle protein